MVGDAAFGAGDFAGHTGAYSPWWAWGVLRLSSPQPIARVLSKGASGGSIFGKMNEQRVLRIGPRCCCACVACRDDQDEGGERKDSGIAELLDLKPDTDVDQPAA